MILAGILRFGVLLRFVPSAVMVGFISAVGILIVLGQLDNFTGYDAAGGHRLTRTLDLLTHPGRIDWSSLVVGVLTIVLIVVLQRTRLGALGMVVAIGAGSALAAVLNGNESAVRQVRDLATIRTRCRRSACRRSATCSSSSFRRCRWPSSASCRAAAVWQASRTPTVHRPDATLDS